nr:phage tail spike protein [Ligilactobacillus ruminis]
MYQLNKKQDVIGIVSSDILSATFEEQINTAGNLKFTTAKKLRDDCLYVLFQRPNATTYMCFKILTETQEDNQVSYTAVESAYDELGAYSYIKDLRPQNRTAQEMLTQILAQTRYSVGYVADTGVQTTNFYYTTVLASLQSVVNLFNLEITFDVVFDPIDNKVKKRMVNLYQQQGSRTGRRFEYGDKLLSVTREQSSDELVTALVGRGSSVQVSEGTDGSPDGYSRKITFADVVWKKSAGNPLDKPAGQEYLEDPAATAAYGFSDGKPRIGFVEFDKIDDKNLLIKATYDKLQELKRPKVSFKASVTDVGNLNLGDTVAIIRHDLKIEYLTRVYKVTHDLLNRQNNTIELGDDFQKSSITSTISAVQDTVQSAKEYSQSALQSANGKNTNFYGASQPLYAVKGDLWYKDLGNGETEMYQYKNGNWELITSTADIDFVAKQVEEINKTVPTKKEVEEADKKLKDEFDAASALYKSKADAIEASLNGQQQDVDSLKNDVKSAQTEYDNLSKKVNDNKKETDADYAAVSGKLNDTTTTIVDVKKTVSSLQTTVADNTGNINTIKTDVAGTKQNIATAKGDITSIKADVSGVKTTVAGHTGKITQLTADVNGVKSSVSNKVDKTTYQSYVTQTDKALSAKLTASDLQGYAKTTDLETRAGKIEASLTSLQGDMSYKATTLVDKPEFSDGDVGGWVAGGKPAVLYKTGGVDGYHYSVQSQNIDNLYASAYWKPVASESKWYVEALIPNFEPAGGKNVYANASLYYIRPSDGKNAWSFVDCGAKAIAPQHWGWVKGYVTVPYGVTKVKPCISMKRADGTNIKSAVKYCQFTLVNAGVQNQLTTLSGKITATSDRLSSVYTKSDTDSKISTALNQSAAQITAAFTQNGKTPTLANLDASGVYLKGKHIYLDGNTYITNGIIKSAAIADGAITNAKIGNGQITNAKILDATISSAKIASLDASKITTGTIDAAKINVINIDASKITTGTLTAVEMHQNGGGADTWINKDGIHNQMGNDNVWIKEGTLAAFDSSGQGMYMESGQLTLASHAYWQNGWKDESIDYGVIKCDDDITGKKGIGIIGKGGFNLRTDNSTANAWTGNEMIGSVTAGAGIIGTDDGKLILGSLKPVFIEGGWSFNGYDGFNHIPFVQVGGQMSQAGASLDKNGSSVVINAWDIKLNACGKTNRNIILNRLTYNGEHTITLNDSTSDLWWGPKMHAPSFVNTSALSKKMNIKKLDVQTAINAIKNTDIYDYQFKEYGITGRHYASLIIDDVNDKPQYKAAGAFVDGGGRDDGTQLGYLTVVVQSLLKEIDILKERIDK